MTDVPLFDLVDTHAAIEHLRGLGWALYPPGAHPLANSPRPGRTRHHDHATSAAGARAVAYRAGSQKVALLQGYRATWLQLGVGMTDEEVGEWAGLLVACYWKRCGELREDGMIEPVLDLAGAPTVRVGRAGVERIVCRPTQAGLALLRQQMEEAVRHG